MRESVCCPSPPPDWRARTPNERRRHHHRPAYTPGRRRAHEARRQTPIPPAAAVAQTSTRLVGDPRLGGRIGCETSPVFAAASAAFAAFSCGREGGGRSVRRLIS